MRLRRYFFVAEIELPLVEGADPVALRKRAIAIFHQEERPNEDETFDWEIISEEDEEV